MNPSASASASIAASASSTFVIPQILTLTFISRVCHFGTRSGDRRHLFGSSAQAVLLAASAQDFELHQGGHDVPSLSQLSRNLRLQFVRNSGINYGQPAETHEKETTLRSSIPSIGRLARTGGACATFVFGQF